MAKQVALVIPAKGHSHRLQNKNLLKIGGKSLVRRACEKALQCQSVDAVYLDTESDIIAHECSGLPNLRILRRPKHLATNATDGNRLMMYELSAIANCDILVQTFATAPLLTAETIDGCISFFADNEHNFDSFLTTLTMFEYFWPVNGLPNYDLDNIPNSFDLEPLTMETHGLYGIYTGVLLRLKRRVGNNPMLLPVNKIEALDINDAIDFEIAKRMLQSA